MVLMNLVFLLALLGCATARHSTDLESIAGRGNLRPRCSNTFRFFDFEKRWDCLVGDVLDNFLPPIDCPAASHDRSGLLFRNVYSVDQHTFIYQKSARTDLALVARPASIYDWGTRKFVDLVNWGPFTILPDPATGALSFNLQSMKVACRLYENAENFIERGYPVHCGIHIDCDSGTPRRAVSSSGFIYSASSKNGEWKVGQTALWEFGDKFTDLTKCELRVELKTTGDWQTNGTYTAVMVDDLAVETFDCA